MFVPLFAQKMFIFRFRAKRGDILIYCTPFCLEHYIFCCRVKRGDNFDYCTPFCAENVCVLRIGFRDTYKFNSLLKTGNNNNDNHVVVDLPTGVWKSEFPPCNSSLRRGSRKGDPDTKEVWKKHG